MRGVTLTLHWGYVLGRLRVRSKSFTSLTLSARPMILCRVLAGSGIQSAATFIGPCYYTNKGVGHLAECHLVTSKV